MKDDNERALARLHLDLAHALYMLREEAGFGVEELADRSGLSPAEILTIEEGDTSSLSDVARLCNALNAGLSLNPDFTIALTSRVPIALRRAVAG